MYPYVAGVDFAFIGAPAYTKLDLDRTSASNHLMSVCVTVSEALTLCNILCDTVRR